MSTEREARHPFLRLAVLVLAGWLLLHLLPQLGIDLNIRIGPNRADQLGLVEIPEWVDAQIIEVDGLSRRAARRHGGLRLPGPLLADPRRGTPRGSPGAGELRRGGTV